MYTLTSNSSVIRNSDGACIPFADGNTDYEQYKVWRDAGNIPTPVPQPSLAQVQTDQSSKINTACATQITTGFTSSSLGTAHFYTCTVEDQANLLALLVAGAGGKFTCIDSTGAKVRPIHTDAQLRTLLADGSAFKEPLLAKARMLKDQINTATTNAQVLAIVW